MARSRRQTFDVLVVGAGPAGMAAAARAAEGGAHVGLVDDNFNPAGKSGAVEWKAATRKQRNGWSGFKRTSGKPVWPRVFHQPETGVLLAEATDEICELHYDKLVLATGARERFLPFPGWTVPNVMGAGGLQAMVKSGLSVRGKRVVVAGTGPLLLAVAASLRKHGAEIPDALRTGLLEQPVAFCFRARGSTFKDHSSAAVKERAGRSTVRQQQLAARSARKGSARGCYPLAARES